MISVFDNIESASFPFAAKKYLYTKRLDSQI
ncbi:hypothetical protein HNR50_002010 [Spirochaeta isovalerica]|uniref:Uncharacterized protein n=1 Tax=Spirochaeta isovalerica TaxID=150 RepID=A0A841RAS2_9SPIO|nr:hypothetical protein [Spirochaeta isovalerica]